MHTPTLLRLILILATDIHCPATRSYLKQVFVSFKIFKKCDIYHNMFYDTYDNKILQLSEDWIREENYPNFYTA